MKAMRLNSVAIFLTADFYSGRIQEGSQGHVPPSPILDPILRIFQAFVFGRNCCKNGCALRWELVIQFSVEILDPPACVSVMKNSIHAMNIIRNLRK